VAQYGDMKLIFKNAKYAKKRSADAVDMMAFVKKIVNQHKVQEKFRRDKDNGNRANDGNTRSFKSIL
jgi:hypothetical protein